MSKPNTQTILDGIARGDADMIAWGRRQATNPNVGPYNTVRLLTALASVEETPAPELVPAVVDHEAEARAAEKLALREIRKAITAEVDATLDVLIAQYAAERNQGHVQFKIAQGEWVKNTRKVVREHIEAGFKAYAAA